MTNDKQEPNVPLDNFYRIMADNSADWVYWIAPDNSFRYVSPSCKDITGYSADEFLADPGLFSRIVHPDDREIMQVHMTHEIAQDHLSQVDFRIYHRSGELRWLSHNCVPIFSEAGEFIGRRGSNRDITERKNAEENLRISESRWQLALDAANDAVWDWDVMTGKAYFSPRYYTMLGYEPDEFPADIKSWEDLLHPEDKPEMLRTISHHLEYGESFDLEFRLKNKRGGWQWVLGRGRVMERDKEGRPLRMVGTHVDIDSFMVMQHRLAKRIDELEALNRLSRSLSLSTTLQEVYDGSLDVINEILGPDLIMLYSIEGEELQLSGYRSEIQKFQDNIQTAHVVGECLCGLAAEKKETVYSINIEDDTRCTRTECKQAGIRSYIAIPLSVRGETLGVLSIGSEVERDFSSEVSFLESLTSILAAGIANSRLNNRLSEYSENLEKIVAQRTGDLKKYVNAVEHSQASIVITDKRGKIEYVNPFFCELTGYSRDELIGGNPRVLKSGKHGREFYAEMWEALSRSETWEGEICNKRKDGTLFWENAIISPIQDETGEVINLIGVKNDITAKKRDAQLREHVDRILRHDLKSPLNVIINMPDIHLEDENLTGDQRESLKVIRDAGLTMLEEINRSLDLYKIETGVYGYNPRRMDLTRTLNRVVLETRALTAIRKIEVDARINETPLAESGPEYINGEELLLYSMLHNLLSNAIEASPAGERVKLHTAVEEGVEIVISNQGQVPEEIRDRFFEKYVTYGKQNGTGLGTYTASLIAKTMGGDISMESSAEEGTRLLVSLPR